MSKQVELSQELVKYCEKVAKSWKRHHKFEDWEDDWDTFLNHDINLYVEDNILTVTVYALDFDLFGDLCTVTDSGVNIIIQPWFPKVRKVRKDRKVK